MLSLDSCRWKPFAIGDIAEIVSGRDIYEDERVEGNTPYVSSSAMNNGVTHFLSNTNDSLESECLSVNRNGSVGYAFYHPYKALFSNDCRKLRLKVRNKYVGLFIATVITKQRTRYSYGYKMGTARMMRQPIMLPVNDEGEPDYAFMEEFMRELEEKLIQEYMAKAQAILLTPPP